MSAHITHYETKNGKTRRVKHSAGKAADKTGAPGTITGAEPQHNPPASPAK